MRRATAATAVTIVGLVGLLRFQVRPLPPPELGVRAPLRAAAPAAPATGPPTPTASPTPATSTSTSTKSSSTSARSHATTSTSHGTTAAGPSATTRTTSTTAAAALRQVDGPTVESGYGPVQVRITLSGRRLQDVQALQLPSDRSRSRQISADAAPKLRQEAIAAQSASIDAVSGASYTSAAYIQSLQAALDAGRQ